MEFILKNFIPGILFNYIRYITLDHRYPIEVVDKTLYLFYEQNFAFLHKTLFNIYILFRNSTISLDMESDKTFSVIEGIVLPRLRAKN